MEEAAGFIPPFYGRLQSYSTLIFFKIPHVICYTVSRNQESNALVLRSSLMKKMRVLFGFVESRMPEMEDLCLKA